MAEIRRTIPSTASSGWVPTGLPGVAFFWSTTATPCSRLVADHGIVLLGQGSISVREGERLADADHAHGLVVGTTTGTESTCFGSAAQPVLGLRLDVDWPVLYRLDQRCPVACCVATSEGAESSEGVDTVPLEGPLHEALLRLLDSLDDIADREVVGSAALEEIVYRVLRSPQGRVLRERALTLQAQLWPPPLAVE